MSLRKIHETAPEKALREALEKRGFSTGVDFAFQYPLRHSFILDFAFPDQKVAVEVDGVAWHSSKKAGRRDRFKDKILNERGWKVVRFWDFEIQTDLDGCVETILRILQQRSCS